MGITLTDLHAQCAPPVCTCDQPRLTGGCHSCNRNHLPGECRDCHRPYKPHVPGFNECRRAWRAQLEAVA